MRIRSSADSSRRVSQQGDPRARLEDFLTRSVDPGRAYYNPLECGDNPSKLLSRVLSEH